MRFSILLAALFFAVISFGQPCGSLPTITFNQNTFHLCPGGSPANITASVTGAVGTINYNWFPETGSSSSITSSPGVNTWQYLEITDACHTVIDSVHIVYHPVDITGINISDATDCPGQSGTLGSVQILPNSPVNTYYLYGGGNTYTSLTGMFTNLPGGIDYLVHVENTQGCFKDSLANVALGANNVTALFNSSALSGVVCYGDSTGTAEILNAGGGLSNPYTVYWTHSDGTFEQSSVLVGGDASVNNLTGGQWVVSVVDPDGCAWSESFLVDSPESITMDFTVTNPTCQGFSDGAVQVQFSGGNGGYSAVMTNEAGSVVNMGGMPEINFLVAGWYYTQVTDVFGCTGYDSAYVDDQSPFLVSLTIQDLICAEDGNGSITVDMVQNYHGSYSNLAYWWNPNPSGINGVGATENLNLNGGDYSLTINDEQGCSEVFNIHVSPYPLAVVNLGSTPYSSSVPGSVYVSVDGGTPPYNYQWTNLTTLAVYNGDSVAVPGTGYYLIQVTDDNGCILYDTVYVGYLGISPAEPFKIADVFYNTSEQAIQIINKSGKKLTLYFMDVQGRTVEKISTAQEFTLIPGQLSTGIYYFFITESNEIIQQGKFSVTD